MGALLLVFAVGPWFAEEPLPEGAIARLNRGGFRLHDRLAGWRLAGSGVYWGAGAKGILSPDGQTFACDERGHIALMDAWSGVVVRTIRCGEGSAPIRFVDEGRKLVIQENRGIEIRDIGSGERVSGWAHPGSPFVSLCADGILAASGCVRGSEQRPVVVRDLRRERDVMHVSPLQNGSVWAALSPDGRLLLTGGRHQDWSVARPAEERVVQLWDVATGKELHLIVCPAGLPATTFTPDSKAFVVLSGTTLDVREVASGRLRWRVGNVMGYRHPTRAVFSPDGRRVALLDSYGRVTVRDLTSGDEVCWFYDFDESEGIGFGPAGRLITWKWEESTLRVRDRETGRLYTPSGVQRAAVRGLRFDPTGRTLHALNEAAALTTWDVSQRAAVRTVDLRSRIGPKGEGGDFWTFYGGESFSPRGDRLAVPALDGKLAVFDTLTGGEVASIRPPPADGKIRWRTVFLADGTRFALLPFSEQGLTTAESMYSVMDVRDGKERQRFVPDLREVSSWSLQGGTVSPDGRYVVQLTSFKKVEEEPCHHLLTWDLVARKSTANLRIDGSLDVETGLVLSPDSRSILLIHDGGEMQLRDLPSGRVLQSLAGRGQPKLRPVFSTDGRTFAVAASDGINPTTVSVYERITGGERSVRTFARQDVTALVYSADSGTLVTGHDDGTILLWPTAGRAPDRTMEQLWRDLHADARTAGVAIDELAARPREAELLFRARLRRDRPTPPPSAEQVRRGMASLTAGGYGERQEAITRLAEQRSFVEPALRLAERTGDLELRLRCRRLLAALDQPTAKEIAQTRYVEVLERIGATEMLDELSRGDPFSVLTREAKSSIARVHLRK